MAFRSSATAFSNSGTVTLTATPAGNASGDVALGILGVDGTGAASALPTAWTSQAERSQAAPDGNSYDLYTKTLAGSDSFTTGNITGPCRWTVSCFSGRSGSLTFNFFEKNTTSVSGSAVSTANATSGTVGITSASGDDVAFLCVLDKQGANDTWTFSALTDFTSRQDDDNTWISCGVLTKDNTAGGGDGTLSATITRDTGTSGTGWGGYVVTMPQTASAGGWLNRGYWWSQTYGNLAR